MGDQPFCLRPTREGVDDHRYLQTLENLIKRAETAPRSLDVQQAARSATAAPKRVLESFDFRAIIDSGHTRSRWDTVVASPGIEPVVKGACRLPNGWDFETYDRRRRDIAEAIIKLQQALAS